MAKPSVCQKKSTKTQFDKCNTVDSHAFKIWQSLGRVVPICVLIKYVFEKDYLYSLFSAQLTVDRLVGAVARGDALPDLVVLRAEHGGVLRAQPRLTGGGGFFSCSGI